MRLYVHTTMMDGFNENTKNGELHSFPPKCASRPQHSSSQLGQHYVFNFSDLYHTDALF